MNKLMSEVHVYFREESKRKISVRLGNSMLIK